MAEPEDGKVRVMRETLETTAAELKQVKADLAIEQGKVKSLLREAAGARTDTKIMCEMASRVIKLIPSDNPLYGELKTMFAKYGVTF